jgi:hypothetical protein
MSAISSRGKRCVQAGVFAAAIPSAYLGLRLGSLRILLGLPLLLIPIGIVCAFVVSGFRTVETKSIGYIPIGFGVICGALSLSLLLLLLHMARPDIFHVMAEWTTFGVGGVVGLLSGWLVRIRRVNV